MKPITFPIAFVVMFLAVSCQNLFPHPQTKVLQEAYQKSVVISRDAQITLDTSNLHQAFTQEAINSIEKELKKDTSVMFVGSEENVEWVKVLRYAPPEAVIEVKYFYRDYTFNRLTGVITYSDTLPQRYWRIETYRMFQEDGVWKFDKYLEFVGWSG